MVERILDLRAKLREGNTPVEAEPGSEEAEASPLSEEDRAQALIDLKARNAELTESRAKTR